MEIIEYIKYLEIISKDNKSALLEISLYKVKSAGEIDLEETLFSRLRYDIGLDIISYKVFTKRLKINLLIN